MMMGGFMYLLYDSMTYKLYEDDIGGIERETGKPRETYVRKNSWQL